ncbi:hypothetical protein [Desulfovibrio ferrophilus]|uniref:Uncharacterized protein n=1 Tax=Desulfovibrio ferrophilus TaxID=241368 RepID=A0A2Z6AX48_9BACT|nr:hypothetical protein [Desulfovibrio ferrophilus]BBD07726.1 uncharacterized protein DFE_1000 [Desulfovibrio ferrophilus]
MNSKSEMNLDDVAPQNIWERRLLFDRQDYELLRIVNDVLERGGYAGWKKLLAPYLHPNGIKEMATTFGLRIAYSVVNLLGSLESGEAVERLAALRTLRDEILTAPQSAMRYNTSRVLLQIMKELVRSKGNDLKQLQLAHDFRLCVSGKPRMIRDQLEKYHLLEMHEDRKQLAFDDHVHDAYSKGRKTPSHLVMDAWIKGLRKVTLIYYNHIPTKVAWEVLNAAEIMGLSVRICVELRARHMGRYVKLLWTPRDLTEAEDFMGFLKTSSVQELMRKGREVSTFQQKYVWRLVDKFNKTLRFEMARKEGVDVPEIDLNAFSRFLGAGQPSVDQLANYLSLLMGTEFHDQLDSEYLLSTWLAPTANPDIPNPFVPSEDEDVPELLRHTPASLTKMLGSIHPHNWITLDPEGLDLADMTIVLAECNAAVTHLETLNLRAHATGSGDIYRQAIKLQEMLNSANAIRCKRFLNKVMDDLRDGTAPQKEQKRERLLKLREKLHDFYGLYRKRPLRSRAGTDSTGKSTLRHGMGIVVAETLPPRAQRCIRKSKDGRHEALPLFLSVKQQVTYSPRPSPSRLDALLQRLPGGRLLTSDTSRCWLKGRYSLPRHGKGNLHALGGKVNQPPVETSPTQTKGGRPRLQWSYLNSKLKNSLKILLGLLPAAASFYFTKDWWLLAWFGALIWFTITGFRNIIQSVLGCGGLRRSRLLKWKDLVSWDRLSDSLLFTGFSVPLLDWLVKMELLDKGLGINTSTNPLLLYTIMAIVNGLYISGHNIVRGLPRSAIVGNLFRSMLSIPLAFMFNGMVGQLLLFNGVVGVDAILQKWAAIISKFASDCIAGVIEGLADRSKYIALRRRDLKQKIKQMFDTHAQLEMMYPQDDVIELLEMPKAFIETLSTEQKGLERIVIVNALDFMYMWMYQPRARSVMASMMRDMSPEERRTFLLSQYVLQREKEISVMLVNGLVGKHFSGSLAFYLDNVQDYLDQIQRVAARSQTALAVLD